MVDSRALQASGIGRYLREVLAHLLRDPRFGRLTLLGSPSELREFADARGSVGTEVRIVPLESGFYSPRMQLEWPIQSLRGRVQADLAFFPHYDAPLAFVRSRSVVVIHDLTHFKLPEMYSAWKRVAAGVVLNRVVRRAARVLVDSESTGRDLVERLPGIRGKIEFVPLGVGSVFLERSADGSAEITPLRPYLLFVGNRKPHKNLVAAVETLALLQRQRPELKLVLAGYPYPGWGSVLERAQELGVRDSIVELDGVDDAKLRSLYTGCEALLFPSFYEGFGLPVLEAMACGAPVISSDRASLPEVVGEAGILVPPDDPQAMADAVSRLHGDPALREELRRRGRERAASFTWEATARRTADVLYQTATAG